MNTHNRIRNVALAAACTVTAACSSQQPSTSGTAQAVAQERERPQPVGGGAATARYLPKAVIYRTTADYHDRVPVTMDEGRTKIVAYPAPTDLRSATPLQLADGYLLDRRGVTANTAFLTYTYDEYTRLEKTPSASELMAHLLDTHPMKELYTLPITAQEAAADTAHCNAYIRSGFKGCTPAMPRLQIYKTK